MITTVLGRRYSFILLCRWDQGKVECSSIYRLAYCCWREASQVARVLSHIKRKQRALFPYNQEEFIFISPSPLQSNRQNIVRRYLCIILGGDSHIEEVTFYTNIWSYVVLQSSFTRIHSNTFKSFLMLTQIYIPQNPCLESSSSLSHFIR